MELEVKLPQLIELTDKIEELRWTIVRLDKKLEALATAAPEPVQIDLPLTAEKPKRQRKAKPAKPAPVVAAEATKDNGEDHDTHEEDEDVDALRSRVAFESKRVTRTFGVGASRAVIRKIAGDNILQVDDVPVEQLMTLLDALRAM